MSGASAGPRRVLVTGAASGLGAALVARFEARGDRVLATDRVSTGSTRGGGSTSGLRLDVTSDDDWAAARAWVEQTWGGLDVLVNNAGVAGGGRVDVATTAEWERLVEVNLLGVVRGCRTFAPLLKAQRSGLVVNVASLAGLVHPPGMGAYNAVKAAVVAFSETLAHELAPYGVRCAAVCPSYFRSDLAGSLEVSDADVAAKVSALVTESPLTADDIAAAVLDGLDRGEELILPDAAARAAYDLKRTDRAAYDAQMRRTADRLEERTR